MNEDKLNSNSYSKTKTPPVYNYCRNCGASIPSSRLFCSQSCCREYKQKEAYNDFLNNPEKYCRPNYTPKSFKKIFIEEQGGVCAICGCKPEWNGKPLVFILDHINGDASDNHRENLRMICPNCDTQLPTFKSKNKNSTRRNYWKNKIINDLSNKNDDQQNNDKSD